MRTLPCGYPTPWRCEEENVCVHSSPFSAGGEKVCLYLRASFPPSALWITVIVSFVALSRMTDYNQQDEWGQLIVVAARLARSAFSSSPLAGARTCSVPGPTACMLHGAPAMRPGRSSHAQVAGFPVPTHNWIPDIPADVWDRAATVSTQERRASPRSHWKPEWRVTTVWSTSAPNRKICQDLIRRKSGNCSNHCLFFFGFSRNTGGFYSGVFLLISCLFSEGVLGWICSVINLSRWSTWCFHWLLISILMTTPPNNWRHAIIF